jgi:hypothetical protein
MASNIGQDSSLMAKFSVVMISIEIAKEKGRYNLFIDSDSQNVIVI